MSRASCSEPQRASSFEGERTTRKWKPATLVLPSENGQLSESRACGVNQYASSVVERTTALAVGVGDEKERKEERKNGMK